jgi:hypothetical protein
MTSIVGLACDAQSCRARDERGDPVVRARLVEFLGGPPLAGASSRFICAEPPAVGDAFRPLPPAELDTLRRAGGELYRSLWDRDGLIADLDFDYLHFDRPQTVYDDPGRAFAALRPVVAATRALLAESGIHPLHLVSGRGHHLIWRIPRRTATAVRLAALGHVGPELAAEYRRPQPPRGEPVPLDLAAAHAGLGRLLEHVGHEILARAAAACPVSLQLAAVEVGPGPGGREVAVLDLSAYGDPLHRRTLRVPFSPYLRPLRRPPGEPPADRPPLVVLPLRGSETATLAAARDRRAVAAEARRSRALIPDGAAGTGRLLDAYQRSPLAAFHDAFYRTPLQPVGHWDAIFRRLLDGDLPPCVRLPLERPNDLLLRPAALQHVTRALLARGWRPRDVAGLIHARYASDLGWRAGVHFHEPRVRAEHYVRLFAGLVAAGRDELVDFNCVSTQEKGYCPAGGCRQDLGRLRDELLGRRDHARLAGRPFDGLLPPHQAP